MLKTISLTEKFQRGAPCVMLLGGFDGLHAGHRKMLKEACAFGLPVGIMTITGGKGSPLFLPGERDEIFKEAGADFVFEMPFAEIKDFSPGAFVRIIVQTFRPRALFCGEDFRFGKDAAGTAETLKRLADAEVRAIGLVCEGGNKVSTTAIKELLEEGDAAGAARLLGTPFFVRGKVFKDRQVGRTIGFPTANILYPAEKFPIKRGVYESLVRVGGKAYKGITNFGARPTFGDERVVTETYLDGFSGSLYGRTIEVKFIRFLRDICNFETELQLKFQLERDIRRVRLGE